MKTTFLLRGLQAGLFLITNLGSPILAAEAPIDLGTRRELFVDPLLVDSLQGDARLTVHSPKPQEVVLVTDQPWEGNTCAYYTLFQDGDLYRMYYRGSHFDETTRKSAHPEVVCYAESRDGIHWVKPKLGLVEFQGSKDNNIVWDGVGGHNFTPFLDTHPDCPPQARYKALARGRSLRKEDKSSKHGLFAFQSPDGLHWTLMAEEPVITEGAFDSQNLAFYDPVDGVYREYHRWFSKGVRDIMVGTSTNFLHWSKPQGLIYTEAAREHLYTNAIRRYDRAPHLLIGFPTRFLPKEKDRVEPVFMSSRDGLHFHRWPDPVIPETAPKDRQGNRSNYMTWGMLELPGQPGEYSVYATEAYYTGPDSRVRRFTFRHDGFTSLHAGSQGGSLTTPLLTVGGHHLEVNYKTRENGFLRLQLLDPQGKALATSVKLTGDDLASQIQWNPPLPSIPKHPVRLQFELKNADVYSFRFLNSLQN